MLTAAHSTHYRLADAAFRKGDSGLPPSAAKSSRLALEISLPSSGHSTVLTVDQGDIIGWTALDESRLEISSASAVEEVEAPGVKDGALQDLCCEGPQSGVEIDRTLTEVILARLVATHLRVLDVFARGEEIVLGAAT